MKIFIKRRLNTGHSRNSRPYGHAKILNIVDLALELVDYRVHIPLFSRLFIYPINDHMETISSSDSFARLLCVYTDGSKQQHNVGASVYMAKTKKAC